MMVVPCLGMPSGFRVLLLLILSVVMSSCVTYTPAPLEPEKSAGKLISARLDPSHGPWSMEQLSRYAAESHPEVAVAKAKLETAKAALGTAAARPNPTVGWSPTWVSNPGDAAPWVFGFTLDIPVETAGKRDLRMAKARAEINSAALEVAAAIHQAKLAVREAFESCLEAKQRREVIVRQIETQQHLVELMERQCSQGQIARQEVTPVRLLLQQTRMMARTAEARENEARAGLAAALGLTREKLDEANIDWNHEARLPAPPALGPLRAQALRNHTEVLAALSDYAVAEASLRLEVARQFPDLHLTTGYEYDQGSNKWSLPGLSATLPLFDRNRGPIAEAVAKRSESAVRVVATQAKVIASVEAARTTYQGTLTQLAEARSMVADQNKNLESIRKMVQAGGADSSSLRTAEVELASAELAQVEAEAETRKAARALEAATQFPFP